MAVSHGCRTSVISESRRPRRFDSGIYAVARKSMQNGEFARSTQRLIQMLRPENVVTAAQTAMTWFKPLPFPRAFSSEVETGSRQENASNRKSGIVKPIRFSHFPATLGRLGQ